MIGRRRNLVVGSALAVPVTAIAIAGCGGSGNANASPHAGSAKNGATVNVRNTKLGNVLVDSQGRTLYLFEKDKTSNSTCTGACASVWPPFRSSGKPKAGAGVKASLLGTTSRSDGKPELTYNGHPLYYYTGDQKAGDTNGEGLDQFGAEWYVLSPAGNKIEGHGSTPASTSASTDFSSTPTAGGRGY